MKTKNTRFDTLVARYYPTVYGFASRLTEDPRCAVALTRAAFESVRARLQEMRNPNAIATALIGAVIRSGLAAA